MSITFIKEVDFSAISHHMFRRIIVHSCKFLAEFTVVRFFAFKNLEAVVNLISYKLEVFVKVSFLSPSCYLFSIWVYEDLYFITILSFYVTLMTPFVTPCKRVIE